MQVATPLFLPQSVGLSRLAQLVWYPSKDAGKTGYVVLLQRDQFSHDTRYMTDPMKTIWGSMTEKIGRTGFVVMVDPDQPDKDGKRERFYVKAEYIRPIKDGVE